MLILDEWFMTDLTKAGAAFLFELSEKYFNKASTILCTLYKKAEWITISILVRINYGIRTISVIPLITGPGH